MKSKPPPGHGGPRKGAGRPRRLPKGLVTLLVRVTPRQRKALAAFAEAKNTDSSKALRGMLDKLARNYL